MQGQRRLECRTEGGSNAGRRRLECRAEGGSNAVLLRQKHEGHQYACQEDVSTTTTTTKSQYCYAKNMKAISMLFRKTFLSLLLLQL